MNPVNFQQNIFSTFFVVSQQVWFKKGKMTLVRNLINFGLFLRVNTFNLVHEII